MLTNAMSAPLRGLPDRLPDLLGGVRLSVRSLLALTVSHICSVVFNFITSS